MEFDEETNLIDLQEMLLNTLNIVDDTIQQFENQKIKVIDLNIFQLYQIQDFTKFN